MSGQQTNVPLWTHWARFTAFMTERFLGGPPVSYTHLTLPTNREV